ncbi:MAG TPA: LLM class flavin-dependent oxidoreductase [Candidatus Nitrosotalea sp.]|nr:LLM class flavin-dependent oxidoreductase [Candidatus Nitrosotalea sp.]
MRIGFSLGSLLSINEVLECSKILSNYNADSIWIPETWGMECSSMLSTIAQIAKKPMIGSSIMNIYSRTPSLVAMNAVTIDTLSNGRLILGLGSSSQSIVEQWHGMEFTRPLQRMQEYVEIIRQIISGKKVTYDGKFFHLRNFRLLIKPIRTEIPIYLAAINQKMVELTWGIGDGVIFYLRPMVEMQKTIMKMQNKRKIDVACQVITCISNDIEKAMVRAKKTISFYVSVGKTYREFLAKNGYEKETNEIFEEYGKSGLTNNYRFVSDSMVNSLALCGTPKELAKKMEKFTEIGVDLPILQFNPIGNVTESFRLLVSSLERDM